MAVLQTFVSPGQIMLGGLQMRDELARGHGRNVPEFGGS